MAVDAGIQQSLMSSLEIQRVVGASSECLSWKSVVTNAECQHVAVAVHVHVPGITARNAAHCNDGMAVGAQFLE